MQITEKLDVDARRFMEQDAFDSFISQVDFRDKDHIQYPAGLLFLITFIGVTLGENSWNEIAEMAEDKIDLLRRYYPNLKRAPSHDTLRRFFMLVPPEKLEMCYRLWAKEICRQLPVVVKCDLRSELEQRLDPMPNLGQHIAIDGKTIRNSMDKAQLQKEEPDCTPRQIENARLHMVSAFVTELGLSLGQERVSAKSNEISVIPDLIRSLNIFEGDVVTLDAMGTQTTVVDAIVEKGADYVLTVKDNQKTLRETIESVMSSDIPRMPKRRNDHAYEYEDSHGREVRRNCYLSAEPICLGKEYRRWAGIKSFGFIDTESTDKKSGKVTTERHCFISSLGKDASQILKHHRLHWGIENGLHWRLDVQFNEDDDRKKMNAAVNFSLVKKIAIARLYAMDTTDKFKSRKKRLSRNDEKLIRFIDDFLLTFSGLAPTLAYTPR